MLHSHLCLCLYVYDTRMCVHLYVYVPFQWRELFHSATCGAVGVADTHTHTSTHTHTHTHTHTSLLQIDFAHVVRDVLVNAYMYSKYI